jgi:hypothetical protein
VEKLPSGSYWSFVASINKIKSFLSSALDDTKFDPSTLVRVPNINTQGFWEASLDGALVNGVDTGLTGRTTILDTGEFLIHFHMPVSLPKVLNQNIHRHDIDGSPR